MTKQTPQFALGSVVSTPGALSVLARHGVLPTSLSRRHVVGDWGHVSDEDAQANEEALKTGGRLLSAYTVGESVVWLITEADRSATTFLLPSEY